MYDLKTPRRVHSRIGFGMSAGIVFVYALSIGLNVIFQLCSVSISADVSATLSTLLMYACAFPLVFLIVRGLPAQAPRPERLGKRFFVLLLICYPILAAGNWIGNILSLLLSFGSAENPVAQTVDAVHPLTLFVLTVLLAPAAEELLFRKIVLDRCARFGERTAIFFSALLFGLYHQNFFQFFYAFGIGLVFAYVYLRTGKLRYSVAMHTIINFFGGFVPSLLRRLPSIETLTLEATEAELAGGLLTVLCYCAFYSLYFGAIIAGAILFAKRLRRMTLLPASEELPREAVFRTVYVNAGVIVFVAICLGLSVLSLFG